MITGVVLARNEEANIVECLEALRPHVAELLLIDMESSDRTVELARPLVDKVLSHPRVPNFDAARNIAIDEARHEWLWFIDADERVPEVTGRMVNDLVREQGSQFEAISIPFKSYFCGQWMQHCGRPWFAQPRAAPWVWGRVVVGGFVLLLVGPTVRLAAACRVNDWPVGPTTCEARPHYPGRCPGLGEPRPLWGDATTSDDLCASQLRANRDHYPHGLAGGTPADRFAARPPSDQFARDKFRTAVVQYEQQLNRELCTAGLELADTFRALHHCRAVRRVLVVHGYLDITWRSIPQPLPPAKQAELHCLSESYVEGVKVVRAAARPKAKTEGPRWT